MCYEFESTNFYTPIILMARSRAATQSLVADSRASLAARDLPSLRSLFMGLVQHVEVILCDAAKKTVIKFGLVKPRRAT